jgi:hypothetical protein
MLAFEWNYTPRLGYVCSKHPHLHLLSANTCVDGAVNGAYPFPVAVSGMHLAAECPPLQVQSQYYVSSVQQLQAIPKAWLSYYFVITTDDGDDNSHRHDENVKNADVVYQDLLHGLHHGGRCDECAKAASSLHRAHTRLFPLWDLSKRTHKFGLKWLCVRHYRKRFLKNVVYT